jgi:hypothetical protein
MKTREPGPPWSVPGLSFLERTSTVIVAPSLDPDTIKRIADLQPGWHAANDICWEVAPTDDEARTDVKRMLEALYVDHHLDRMFIFNRSRPMPCYLVDKNRLLAVAEELER